MKIKVLNFYIVPREHQYDLIQVKQVKNKNTGELSDKEDIVAYGISMERCVSKIVHLNIGDLEGEYLMSEFLERYREDVDRVQNLLPEFVKEG